MTLRFLLVASTGGISAHGSPIAAPICSGFGESVAAAAMALGKGPG